jgi:5-hydroxyisourate hydrolase-like protein (transthyretin family)
MNRTLTAAVIAAVLVARPVAQAPAPAPQAIASATRIAGHVIDETAGLPLAGVRVFLYRQPNTGLQGVALTDETGEYAFTGIPPGTYLLGMNKLGYFPTRRQVVQVGSGADLSGTDLKMAKGGEIAGRLLDANGRPESGVSMAAIQIEESGRLNPGVTTDRTTTSGEFTVQSLPPGTYILIANGAITGAEGTSATRVNSITYYPGVTDISRAERIEVSLSQRVTVSDSTLARTRTVSVSGVAVDQSGRALSGSEVTLAAEWMLFGGEKAATRTAADGSFTLGPVAPSVYRLLLDRETITTLTADQDVSGLTLRRAR